MEKKNLLSRRLPDFKALVKVTNDRVPVETSPNEPVGQNFYDTVVVLVQAVFYFVSMELGKKVKLNLLLKKIFEKAKRFFEIPEFKQYAIADGIYKILFASRTGILSALIRRQNKGQLLFPFAIALT